MKTQFLNQIVREPEQTASIARNFARELTAGDVVAFYGDLGTGKTFFIKKMCRALGVREEATSPSFTIINQYHVSGEHYIYHFDFYRLESAGEVHNLGLEEFFYNNFICLVEWADRIRDFLPARRWEVYLDFIAQEPESRKISIVKEGQ